MTLEIKKYEYLKFTKSIHEEYLLLQEKYSKIYNTDKTIVLMQVGSFHEIYSTNKRGYDLHKLSSLLNIIVSKKNKKIPEVNEKNPYMIGFPIISTPKFLKILIDNNFHVIKIDQVTPKPYPKRAITGIFSPGTYIDDISTSDSNNILCIFIEEIKQLNSTFILFIGLSIIDLSVGKSIVHETFSVKDDDKYSLDETLKFIHNFNPREVIIYYKNLKTYKENELISYLELNDRNYLINKLVDNEYQNILYQENFLKNIYKIDSIITAIEELDLEKNINARLSFILLLNYCKTLNSEILVNIDKPLFYTNSNYLHLGNNALDQLNVINYDNKNKSLFDIINFTYTSMGKRLLKFNLCNPLCDVTTLNNRYNMIEIINNSNLKLDNNLKKIIDIERSHRKISLQTLNPFDFVYLHDSYLCILSLFDSIKNTKLIEIYSDNLRKSLSNYINYYSRLFNFDEMQKYNLIDINSSFFTKGINVEIDNLQNDIDKNYNLIDNFRMKLEKLIDNTKKDYFNSNESDEENTKNAIQILFNEKDKYYLSTTLKRGQMIKSKIKDYIIVNKIKINKNELKFKEQTCTMKINCEYINNLSDKIILISEKLKPLVKSTYKNYLKQFFENYSDLYLNLNNMIAHIDFLNSGSICSIKNKYCKPNIIKKEKSFIDVKLIRHPIIENIIFNKYTPHNLVLDEKQNGILLYGLNSAGKSSLMKSIGLNIILAQIGYYTSAFNFTYSPYKSIFTRITNTDNIYKGLSSFGLELVELKAILKRSGLNTLVLADEVCKGTEHKSALIIVSAMILMLTKSSTTFISATHLHELTKIKLINEIDNLGIYNIGVKYENNNIIFNRKLQRGNGIEEYGLDFAKYIINDKEFVQVSQNIKDSFENNDFNLKKSRYNPKVLMDKCSICNSKQKLETHHIKFQKNTDNNGFLIEILNEHIHKNHTSNLVTLCSKCHDDIHNNLIKIDGYEESIKGNKLKCTKVLNKTLPKTYTDEEISYIREISKYTTQKKMKDLFENKFLKKISIKKISNIVTKC